MGKTLFMILLVLSSLFVNCSNEKESQDEHVLEYTVLLLVYESQRKPDLSDIPLPDIEIPVITIPEIGGE